MADSDQNINHVKKLCLGLKSSDKKERKLVYIELQKYISNANNEFTDEDLSKIFCETHMYILNGLRDKAETVREQAIRFTKYFIVDKLPINDFYLSYLLPILVERIGSVEIIEESEEIRFQLLQMFDSIISKYSNTIQLKPFLNDSILILSETVKDKYPAIKELSCRSIVNLAKALPRDFHMQAENLIKPVLSCFGHQRYKVRVESIYAIGEIIMHSSYKGLDEVTGPLAEKLFDQIPTVRRAVGQIAARWMLDYRDRYSFFYKILPLLLTGLNDEVAETRTEAANLWKKVGLQYQQENEKDLKDQLDYLTALPKYYPENVIRPNLGCRTLVKRNVSKLSGAIARELMSWQGDVRVRCSQLLCSLTLHAECDITQNLQDLLVAMYSAARDEDNRVVENIICSSEMIGCFIKYETWSELVLPTIEDGPHFGHLIVLYGLLKGSPVEFITDYVEDLSKILAEDMICNTRKGRYQLELLKCVQILSVKYTKGPSDQTGYFLFKILLALISLKHPDNADEIDLHLWDDLGKSLGLKHVQDMWIMYTGRILEHINRDVNLWTPVTDDKCIFTTVLANCNEAFGQNLEIIRSILIQSLDSECNAETRLKIFYVLATAFENRENIFKNADGATQFLESLIQDIFIPSLVWHAGATAEVIRTMAASCLKCALQLNVELFVSETFRPLVDKLIPLLLSLMEDASYRSRQLALDCITLLKENCAKKKIWTLDDLIKVYPEVLNRLDDPTEKVRLTAIKNLPTILRNVPYEFKGITFKAHHELLIDTLMTHFDDDDEHVQEMIYDVLEVVASINRQELLEKVAKHKPLLRNHKGCDRIFEKFKDLNVTS